MTDLPLSKIAKKDIVEKIKILVAKESDVNESDICNLMILVRKLLDTISELEEESYLTTKLFCNWSVHTEISNSNTGLRILAKVNDTLVEFGSSTDLMEIQIKMSDAIGLSVLRKELKDLFQNNKINDSLFSDNNLWAIFISNLLEIISATPLSFPPLESLDETRQKIYNKIAKNPIKAGAGVFSIKISVVSFPPEIGGEIMCMILRSADTTTAIIPLVIDARL